MGLDITAYTKLTLVTHLQADLAGKIAEYIDREMALLITETSVNSHFPGREAGIDVNALYWFPYKSAFRFRAGAYSRYGEWRRGLAGMVGYAGSYRQEPNPGPFMELIYFSDCEGIIGPAVSSKLARDFEDNLERAKVFSPSDQWIDCYNNWRKAFNLAADNGVVEFH